jgi:glucose repression regulatory protein TUP1
VDRPTVRCNRPVADSWTTVTRHIQDIELIRGKIYSLEQQHNQMKAK